MSLQRISTMILVASLAVAPLVPARAQLDIPGPMHLAHIHGVYVDEKGAPIEGADVTLVRNDKVIYSTRTDRAGKFAIRQVSGRFWLRMNMKGYSEVSRDVIVGVEALMYLRKDTLYVIAGPGACTDDCSSVFLSKDKFNQAIRRNTGHPY
jgi:hypothetical protein